MRESSLATEGRQPVLPSAGVWTPLGANPRNGKPLVQMGKPALGKGRSGLEPARTLGQALWPCGTLQRGGLPPAPIQPRSATSPGGGGTADT